MAGRTSVALVSYALVLSLFAAGGSASVAEVAGIGNTRLNETQTCQACKHFLEELASSAKLPMVQDNLAQQEHLQVKQMCAKLAKDEQQKCEEEIRKMYKSVTCGLVKLNASSTEICLDAHLCGPGAITALQEFSEADFGLSEGSLSDQAMLANSSDAGCPMCKFMLTQALAYLEDNRTESKLFAEAHKVCETMGEHQAECVAGIDQIGTLILPLVKDISPEAACHLAQSCAPNDEFPGQLVIPQRIKAGFLEWLNQTGLNESSLSNQCDCCRTLVSEATQLLGNTDIQHQLLTDMKDICSIFETFEHQCSSYVQMYGPMAIMTGLGYLQFDTACSDAGLCSLPPGPGKLNLEQQEFAALQEATT